MRKKRIRARLGAVLPEDWRVEGGFNTRNFPILELAGGHSRGFNQRFSRGENTGTLTSDAVKRTHGTMLKLLSASLAVSGLANSTLEATVAPNRVTFRKGCPPVRIRKQNFSVSNLICEQRGQAGAHGDFCVPSISQACFFGNRRTAREFSSNCIYARNGGLGLLARAFSSRAKGKGQNRHVSGFLAGVIEDRLARAATDEIRIPRQPVATRHFIPQRIIQSALVRTRHPQKFTLSRGGHMFLSDDKWIWLRDTEFFIRGVKCESEQGKQMKYGCLWDEVELVTGNYVLGSKGEDLNQTLLAGLKRTLAVVDSRRPAALPAKRNNQREAIRNCCQRTVIHAASSKPIVSIMPDDTAGRRVFSGISCFSCPYITALLRLQLASPSSARKTSLLRFARFSLLTHSFAHLLLP
ncbi:hypothetical protein PR048_007809 [Dryococelus australis]|uniref:Uncharacterized protein n=1 Tax=Dryococelus australis TaxID=614101 RepID=A0ABQ9HVP2_9NEOP|nr:hypothetical protein PR048_007809 [Dryococelus australis]